VLAPPGQLTGPAQQVLEAAQVDLVVGQRQPVSAAGGLHRPPPDDPAKPGHTSLDHLLPRGRQVVTPQRVGQLLGRQHVTGPDRQR
jgi:hypothetical protein